MSSYDRVRTDPELERKGVPVEYGDIRVTLARAGGANIHYNKIMERKVKPIRRALDTGQVSSKAGDRLVLEVFAESVILNWEIRDEEAKAGEPEWKPGVEDPDTGEILEPCAETYIKVLGHVELRDLFQFIQQDATGLALYLQNIRKDEAKN